MGLHTIQYNTTVKWSLCLFKCKSCLCLCIREFLGSASADKVLIIQTDYDEDSHMRNILSSSKWDYHIITLFCILVKHYYKSSHLLTFFFYLRLMISQVFLHQRNKQVGHYWQHKDICVLCHQTSSNRGWDLLCGVSRRLVLLSHTHTHTHTHD